MLTGGGAGLEVGVKGVPPDPWGTDGGVTPPPSVR